MTNAALTLDEAAQALRVSRRWLEYWLAAHPVDAAGSPFYVPMGRRKTFEQNDIARIRACIREEERCRLSSIGVRGSGIIGAQLGRLAADSAIAARLIAEIEKRYWDGYFDGPSAILTFRRAVALYRAAGKSDEFLTPIENYLGDTLVKDINGGIIRQMAIELFGNNSGASRNRRAITPTQAVINHCAESDLCSPIRVKRFETEKSEKEPATLAWVKSFQAAAKPHLGAYALFMFLTGCRPSEALAVERVDLDLRAATVIIRETKVSRERKAHLPAMLVSALANLEDVPGRPLFVYRKYIDMRWSWHHTIEKAEIPVLTPHCCRHGFATELLRRGVDVVTVAWLGGWASPAQVLKTYGHAMKRRDQTDILADEPLTHAVDDIARSAHKIRLT
jgi:integrase